MDDFKDFRDSKKQNIFLKFLFDTLTTMREIQ